MGAGGIPGDAGEGCADGVEGVLSVFAGGGDVAADGVAVAGCFVRAEAAADLLPGLCGAQLAFGLVGGGRDGGDGEEPQYVGLAVPEAFHQQIATARGM